MEQIHRQSAKGINEIRHVAVVIGESDVNQRHTGILFQVDEENTVQFLHLAWHKDLRCQPNLRSEYCWVDPKIPTLRLKQLAGICEDIVHANEAEGIPYSFGPPVNVFDDETKEFLLGPTNTGLTCASFVLAVFERGQLPLVRCEAWPPPDAEDIEWQEKILQLLRADRGGTVSESHLDVVRTELGTSARYRPEQVAAAVALRKRRPVKYRYAKSLGANIVRYIRDEPEIEEFQLSIWDRILNMLGFF